MTPATSPKLKLARVFLSHSWDDNTLTDFLFERLQGRFDLFYDRDDRWGMRKASHEVGNGRLGGLIAGDPSLPKDLIRGADIFLFGLSSSSLEPGRFARKELHYAESLQTGQGPLIVHVALSGFRAPRRYEGRVHGNLRWRTRHSDASNIARELETMLERRIDATHGHIGHHDTPPRSSMRDFLEMLALGSPQGLFQLNHRWPSASKSDAVRLAKQLRNDDRAKVIRRLTDVYAHPAYRTGMARARDNALVLAAMMVAGNRDFADEMAMAIRRKLPDYANPSLYRGYQIARAFIGNPDALSQYTLGLAQNAGAAWNAQRQTNRNFHIQYYGGAGAALGVLRESVRTRMPAALLPMNVYTLGVLSEGSGDRELIRERAGELREQGVDGRIISGALRACELRARAGNRN